MPAFAKFLDHLFVERRDVVWFCALLPEVCTARSIAIARGCDENPIQERYVKVFSFYPCIGERMGG
jgi:hypothetical protein